MNRPSFSRILTLVLALALVFPAVCSAESTEPKGEIIEYPVNVTVPMDPKEITYIAPLESGYIYEEGNPDPIGYTDPSITVTIFRGNYKNTDYVGARIKLANPTQLRAENSGRFGSDSATPGSKLGKRVSSVVAINADNHASRTKVGWVTRQGKRMRHSCNAVWDVLVIDREGDLHILPNATNADVEALEGAAVNIFTFGPGLIIDGVPQFGCGNGYMGEKKPAQRMALIQTGKLEYTVLTSEGPEDKPSVGLLLDEFIELVMMECPDAINAYNMDGGSACTLVFKNSKDNYSKINAPRNPKIRPLNDIIYFASAWQPAPEQTEEPAPAEGNE